MASTGSTGGQGCFNSTATWIGVIYGIFGILAFLGYSTIYDLFGSGSPQGSEATGAGSRSGAFSDAAVHVSPNHVNVGDRWAIEGSGFTAYGLVTIWMGSQILTRFSADQDGGFSRNYPPLEQSFCKYSGNTITVTMGEDPYASTPASFC